jgi:hypothetical protein
MNPHKKMLKLLYRSFDDPLPEEEQQRLKKALENSPGLRREKEQLEAQRQAVANSAIHSFKPFFADRVISLVKARESQPNGLELQRFYESLLAVFRKVAIAGALLSIIFIIYNLKIGDNLPVEEAFTLSELTLQEILAIF